MTIKEAINTGTSIMTNIEVQKMMWMLKIVNKMGTMMGVTRTMDLVDTNTALMVTIVMSTMKGIKSTTMITFKSILMIIIRIITTVDMAMIVKVKVKLTITNTDRMLPEVSKVTTMIITCQAFKLTSKTTTTMYLIMSPMHFSSMKTKGTIKETIMLRLKT